MRVGRSTGATTLAGLVAAALLTFGAPVTPTLVTARQSLCGGHALCPADPPPDGGDQATAEEKIIDGYVNK